MQKSLLSAFADSKTPFILLDGLQGLRSLVNATYVFEGFYHKSHKTKIQILGYLAADSSLFMGLVIIII